MKIKSGFVLREVLGKTVVVAIGERSKSFHGMIKMNKTATHIWKGVEAGKTEDEIATSLIERFGDVTMESALADTRRIIQQMKDAGIIEE